MYTTIYLFLFSGETIIPYDLSGFISTSWVHQIRELSILNSRSAILVLQNNCLAQEPRTDTSKQLSRLRLSESDAGEKECYRTQIKNCEGGPRTLMAEDVCALLSLVYVCSRSPALLLSIPPTHSLHLPFPPLSSIAAQHQHGPPERDQKFNVVFLDLTWPAVFSSGTRLAGTARHSSAAVEVIAGPAVDVQLVQE